MLKRFLQNLSLLQWTSELVASSSEWSIFSSWIHKPILSSLNMLTSTSSSLFYILNIYAEIWTIFNNLHQFPKALETVETCNQKDRKGRTVRAERVAESKRKTYAEAERA